VQASNAFMIVALAATVRARFLLANTVAVVVVGGSMEIHACWPIKANQLTYTVTKCFIARTTYSAVRPAQPRAGKVCGRAKKLWGRVAADQHTPGLVL
jgi:hypothetical protein